MLLPLLAPAQSAPSHDADTPWASLRSLFAFPAEIRRRYARLHAELCTSPGCSHDWPPGVCALSCACCAGEVINGKAAVQCSTCELFFCDVECHRRTPCPHDGSLCYGYEQATEEGPDNQDDDAAAGLGCPCTCCRNRLPPCCCACNTSPCACAGDGVACNGEAWKTRYAPWIAFMCEECMCE